MCFVETPYYHLCGHYGHPVVTPHGRCTRAKNTPGACWEVLDVGIKTIEARCNKCECMINDTMIHHTATAGVNPVDCQRFNQLMKLHKQTFDHRSASLASIPSSVTSTAFLQTADELALRKFSIASGASATSTSTKTMTTGGRSPILTVKSSKPTSVSPKRAISLPASCVSAWSSVQEWAGQTDESEPNNHGAQTM